ncbi:MAG: GNAT family N-acetyltransferase [Flavobacteriaceae bacterium TMED116]|nr:MAG: GNAT family N-acetyltransferase [Flavobacteriaceae bacterium TMED116]OUV51200.1 MAG: GNAT family N-acetyltransferase [Flavobacteriaceae bacterium TMED116]|tara:strand:+ start:3868 stop:4368 length:501 start_codon:yes stop_codon:yes gene_type:complete
MIRKAILSDLDTIKKIAESCAKNMIDNNIFQWNKNYPSKNIFKKDILNQSLYVFEEGNLVKGCIVLCEQKDLVYNLVSWRTKDSKNLYIHRLAVHPAYQKMGLAKSMMDYAENFAKKNNYVSIRLDTFSKNPRNIKFYEIRGYIKLGNIFLPNQSEDPFYCYEKII